MAAMMGEMKVEIVEQNKRGWNRKVNKGVRRKI